MAMRRTLHIIAILLFSLNLQAVEPALENSKVREALNAMQGKPAPALQLNGWLNTKDLDLEKLKGKIVVLDFWATWCGPCIAAIPHTNEMMQKYADKGVVIIGVCHQRGAEKMVATAKEKGSNIRSLWIKVPTLLTKPIASRTITSLTAKGSFAGQTS